MSHFILTFKYMEITVFEKKNCFRLKLWDFVGDITRDGLIKEE